MQGYHAGGPYWMVGTNVHAPRTELSHGVGAVRAGLGHWMA